MRINIDKIYFNMKLKNLYAVLIFSIIGIALNLAIGYVFDNLGLISNLNRPKFDGLGKEIILALVFGPLFESTIFQGLIYYVVKIFNDYLKSYFIIVYLLTSSLIFALSHSYSIYYEIATFIPGLLLAYIFLYFKKTSEYPILLLSCVHSIVNLFMLLLQHVE